MAQLLVPGLPVAASSIASALDLPAIGAGHPLWAGALTMLLNHEDSGCLHSARRAAKLLDRLAETRGIDAETRILCERASLRLSRVAEEQDHARKS